MENLFQEECTLSKDSVERYGIAMKKHAQEWVTSLDKGTQPFVVCDG